MRRGLFSFCGRFDLWSSLLTLGRVDASITLLSLNRRLKEFVFQPLTHRQIVEFEGITGSVLVIILQGNIFVELRTNLYLCRRRLLSWGEYGTTVKEDLRELVYTPVEGSEKILDIDTDCSKPVSDSEIKSFLVDSQGIVNPLMVQSLEKSRRNEVLRTMLSLGAGIRQLSRLTGVSFGVIQKLAK